MHTTRTYLGGKHCFIVRRANGVVHVGAAVKAPITCDDSNPRKDVQGPGSLRAPVELAMVASTISPADLGLVQ